MSVDECEDKVSSEGLGVGKGAAEAVGVYAGFDASLGVHVGVGAGVSFGVDATRSCSAPARLCAPSTLMISKLPVGPSDFTTPSLLRQCLAGYPSQLQLEARANSRSGKSMVFVTYYPSVFTKLFLPRRRFFIATSWHLHLFSYSPPPLSKECPPLIALFLPPYCQYGAFHFIESATLPSTSIRHDKFLHDPANPLRIPYSTAPAPPLLSTYPFPRPTSTYALLSRFTLPQSNSQLRTSQSVPSFLPAITQHLTYSKSGAFHIFSSKSATFCFVSQFPRFVSRALQFDRIERAPMTTQLLRDADAAGNFNDTSN
eukprot:5238883-Pleurochrysis_carterae.AAC.1